MYKDRADESLIIKGKMKLSSADYTLEEARSNLSDYRNAGQFDIALTNLENQTGGDAKKKELKDAVTSSGSQQAVDAAKQLTLDSGVSGGSANGNKAGVAAAAANYAATSAGASPAAAKATADAVTGAVSVLTPP